MHNNYYFLRQLSEALGKKVKDCVVSECFSQNKEELVIRFETHGDPFFIKANLLPSFSCLSFPDQFQRARKNSINLFEPLIGQRALGVRQFENERSFAVLLTNNFVLLFKMHGNRSNLILFQENTVVEMFKNSIEQDTTLHLDTLDRKIDWRYENFLAHQENPGSVYFTFGKLVWQYLEENGFSAKSAHEQWRMIVDLDNQLLRPTTYSITSVNHAFALSLIEIGDVLKTFSNPITAITEFYYKHIQAAAFEREKANTLGILHSKLQNGKGYLDKTKIKYDEIVHDNHFKVWADLIMANLHRIKPGTEKIIIENFYDNNQPMEVKLKRDYSPQKNAAIYYRKSKNQEIETDRLQQAIQKKETEIAQWQEQVAAIQTATDLKALRTLVQSFQLNIEKVKQEEPVPYHLVEYNGYQICIGKNAKANDILTLKYAFKDDLWLHAKDVAGSHVIIKYKAGKTFPKDVIERAAQLAAYNSKRKNETLCPVIVTPKKFVRKRKGDVPGAVVVEREDIVMVEPKN